MKKLTIKQLGILRQSLADCNVQYIEIIDEIVDHIASDIEHLCATEPTLNFNSAKRIVFNKWDKSKTLKLLVKQKRRNKYKEYKKLAWRGLLDYFTFPKIIFSLALVLVFFSITLFCSPLLFKIINIAFLILPTILAVRLQKKLKYINEKKSIYLIDETFNRTIILLTTSTTGIYINILLEISFITSVGQMIFWSLISTYTILSCIVIDRVLFIIAYNEKKNYLTA
ncbi:hypothetical protein [Myroides injenensis]|uniref:hypothetical protein n=1 Tax=Myroides injenensis TaxID=1183151 RepID=UPI0002884887|nr:hypothetical protein [Myroides injenensis]